MIGTMKPRGRMISAKKLDKLRRAYQRGDSVEEAAVDAGVKAGTTYRKFHQFKRDGVARSTPWPHLRRSGEPRPKYPSWRLPTYTGPIWIGKAIDSESRI
jgi:transposase